MFWVRSRKIERDIVKSMIKFILKEKEKLQAEDAKLSETEAHEVSIKMCYFNNLFKGDICFTRYIILLS